MAPWDKHYYLCDDWKKIFEELRITLFRLGRLEFQLKELDEDIEIGDVKAPVGTTVLSVHIPRYLPLNEEDCERSYAWARAFFRKHYGMKPVSLSAAPGSCTPGCRRCCRKPPPSSGSRRNSSF